MIEKGLLIERKQEISQNSYARDVLMNFFTGNREDIRQILTKYKSDLENKGYDQKCIDLRLVVQPRYDNIPTKLALTDLGLKELIESGVLKYKKTVEERIDFSHSLPYNTSELKFSTPDGNENSSKLLLAKKPSPEILKLVELAKARSINFLTKN